MDPLSIKEIILLITNTGAFGVFALLFWRRLIRVTDIFTEEIKDMNTQFAEKINQMDKQHRIEMAALIDRYHEMTERTLETLLIVKNSHELVNS